jgi:hypothetical protein
MSTTLSDKQKQVVGREVQAVLDRSSAYRALPLHDRRRIHDDTCAVAAALVAQRAGESAAAAAPARSPRRRDPYSLSLADGDPLGPGGGMPGDPMAPAAPPAPPDKWRPDERFRAEGIAAGVTQAGRMLNEVNFPGFVASLVKGTFNAVVDASIQQMKAYGELVQGVSMSLNDFRDQNVDVAEGRQHLVSKYPNIFTPTQPGQSGQSGKDGKDGKDDPGIAVREDFDTDAMPDFAREMGLDGPPIDDISDPESLDRLITAARTELARGRQQLLATTILMGINRIIVTDGRINAKLKFDFHASDTMNRQGTVAEYDTSQKQVMDVSRGSGQQWVRGHYEKPVPLVVSTTTATSAADIEAQAKLSGEVNLNFKSETFPLEKMINTDQMFHLNQAQSGARAVPAPAASAPAAPASTPVAAAPAPALAR